MRLVIWQGTCLGVEEGFGHMAVIVKVEEDGGAAWIALERIQPTVAVILHEVKAQLPTRLCLLAEIPHPVPNLPANSNSFHSFQFQYLKTPYTQLHVLAYPLHRV